jgi:ketosteroid isomerase-like protein
VDAEAAARRFAETLEAAWRDGDAERFVALFAEDAVFQPPFGPPQSAREHMRWALGLGDAPAEVWVGKPVVAGDTAVVEWWAAVVVNGEPTTFAATAWIRFDDEGLVVHERDYWNSKSERVEPWQGWGA